MKTSNSRGYDKINSRLLKEIPHISALFITHLTNSIIRTSRFPKCLKTTWILPISKPNKSWFQSKLYRLMANLNVFEKGFEEWINQLMEYVERNYIILKNHHGWLADHSTITTKTTTATNALMKKARGSPHHWFKPCIQYCRSLHTPEEIGVLWSGRKWAGAD